jgi:membrane-associated phospholipid phosphatase
LKNLTKYFYPVELISFAYILLTVIYIAVFSYKIDNAATLLLNRILITGLLLLIAFIDTNKESKFLNLVRYLFAPILIIYWYPETYYMNECIFSNLDHLFIQADEWLFGCQPALEFSKHFPYRWFSELMSFGYFSYYLMIVFIAFYFYVTNKPVERKALFIILCSFFMYYIIFIILPVVGPQFYYPEPANQVPKGYFFRELLMFIQSHGEKPTGAFPSSHVGVSLIFLIIICKYACRYFAYFLPLVTILILSTVYIKAHYVIDVIGGFISVPPIYWLSDKCWQWLDK